MPSKLPAAIVQGHYIAQYLLACSTKLKMPILDPQTLPRNWKFSSVACSASKDGQRFSYMGGKGGPLWKRLIFNLSDPSSSSQSLQPGTLSISSACGDEQTMGTHFLDHLEAQLEQWHVAAKPGELPFDFTGGFVGYMGYEMKAECGAANSHASPDPDAAMFFTDRSVCHLGSQSSHPCLPMYPLPRSEAISLLLAGVQEALQLSSADEGASAVWMNNHY